MNEIRSIILRGRALGRAAAFIGVMGVVLVWFSFQDHSLRVRTAHETVSVLEVRDSGWHVKLGSGETLWIFATPGIILKPGDRIPVLVETYESGNRRIEFDRDRWVAGG